jgi:hypothetical protein
LNLELRHPPTERSLCWRAGTSQHKGSFVLAQSCWWLLRPPAKTDFNRQHKSFLAYCIFLSTYKLLLSYMIQCIKHHITIHYDYLFISSTGFLWLIASSLHFISLCEYHIKKILIVEINGGSAIYEIVYFQQNKDVLMYNVVRGKNVTSSRSKSKTRVRLFVFFFVSSHRNWVLK